MALTGTYVPSKQQWVRDQVAAYEASDGAEANTLRDTGYPIVVITSVGAKSGHLRKNPVMRVERDGRYVAIASKGGSDDNPEWYHNFVAHPEVELQDGPEKHTYAVRLLERRRAAGVVGLLRRDLADVRGVPEADRPRDPGVPARAQLTVPSRPSSHTRDGVPRTCRALQRPTCDGIPGQPGIPTRAALSAGGR